jgi:exonuclease III
MKLITWNLNKRRAIEPQIAALLSSSPDVIALQEVSLNNLPRFREAFASVGYPFTLDSFHAAFVARRSFVMIVSRHPIQRLYELDIPYSQNLLSSRVQMSFGDVMVHNLHSPVTLRTMDDSALAVHNRNKLQLLQTTFDCLSNDRANFRVLCGDFNSPRRELPDGSIITFYQSEKTLRPTKDGAAFNHIHRELLRGLARFEVHDAYRRLHGWNVDDFSWRASYRGRSFGFRLDHILSSESLVPTECFYHHAWREPDNLSDHSAMEATFAVNT